MFLCKVRELSEEEKMMIVLSEEFQQFVYHSAPIVERALDEDKDIYKDYTGGTDREDKGYVNVTLSIYKCWLNLFFVNMWHTLLNTLKIILFNSKKTQTRVDNIFTQGVSWTMDIDVTSTITWIVIYFIYTWEQPNIHNGEVEWCDKCRLLLIDNDHMLLSTTDFPIT